MTGIARTWRRPAVSLLAAAMAVSLAACGGGDDDDGAGVPPDALQAYRDQVVQWGVCDDSVLGARPLPQGLGERLQCAQVRAPMDWAKPERGDVSVAVMRLKAADAAQRKGALLFNPGGPGADGLNMTLLLFQYFRLANPESPLGAQQLKLMASYDMVGFSPRGTGGSTRALCATNELEKFQETTPDGASDANLANVNYNTAKLVEACARNPLTSYINTDATARDMDLIRGLLGDDKLNYVGYSYGTWLGAWYASLFPEKVGRVVLDSSLDYTGTLEKALVDKPDARQVVEDRFLTSYAARHADYFQLGAQPADVRALLNGLHPRVQSLLGDTLSNNSYTVGAIDDSMLAMAAARGLDAVLRSGVAQDDDDAVEHALEKTVFIAGDSADAKARDAGAREMAGAYYEAYAETWVKFKPSSIGTSNIFWFVTCNDSAGTTDPAAWASVVRAKAQSAPRYYSVVQQNACMYWGGPRVAKPDFKPMQSQNILMVQSEFDSATPTPEAMRLFSQLPSAHMVYVPGEFTHGVFPYQTDCVDANVVGYLLGESPKARQTDCAAKPLPKDEAAASTKDRPASAPVPTHTDPEAARKLLEEFKKGLIPPAGAPR